MKQLVKILTIGAMALALTACGERVEIGPGEVGKISGANGYKEGVLNTSKFRLDACLSQCDRLVTLNVGDSAKTEALEIFMPQDKLKMKISVQTNLTIMDMKKVDPLFSRLPAKELSGYTSQIDRDAVYTMYARQIILTESREYLSQFTIAEVASSLDKINSELRERLTKKIQDSTPFQVRYAGITNVEYPSIITEAQENAARRREEIAQEEAKLEVSRVTLERELSEAQLQRRIDVEKAEAEAQTDRLRAAAAANPTTLALRKLENERAWIEAWKAGGAQVPDTIVGNESANLFLGGHSQPKAK